jgi:DNA-binding response OmpR family regulator
MNKSSKPKVFIADDDPGILESTSLILESEGYEVITSPDGETVKKVKQYKPDVVLLDIWLSGINGGDIAKKLKAARTTSAIPLIIFSANRDIEKIAKEVKADDFLIKPFNLPDLLSTIGKHIKQ